MKRMSFVLSIAAMVAISAPLAAQGNGGKYGRAGNGVYDRNGDGVIDRRDQVTSGCSWWDVNCTNTNGRNPNGRYPDGRVDNRSINNSGWYRIGTDRSGNAIYERDTYDHKGRETIELARVDRNGHLKVIDKHKVDNRQNNGRYDTRIYDRRGDRNDRDDDDRDGRDR